MMANFRYSPETEELVSVAEDEHVDPARARTKFFVMQNGEIVFTGTREQLDDATDPYVRRFGKP